MDLEYVTKLIDLISNSKVDEVEIEEDGKKIRITKKAHAQAEPTTVYSMAPPPPVAHPVQTATPVVAAAPPAPAPPAPAPPAAAPTTKLHEVRSPIVGTFFKAPAPDAPAFVQVGSTVQKGSVLCIIEAMKLMNEIECDVAGKVVQIIVENGQPVEYDQVLFLVEPA